MNPFQEHAANMEAYESELSEPINGTTGNTISFPLDLNGNAIDSTNEYPATIGEFVVKQVLIEGGFSPRLMGQAIVRKSVLPPGAAFLSGQLLIAKQIGGSVRTCMVQEVEDVFTEWRLNLWDQNQGA